MEEARAECGRCGRELKDKRSIDRGYGPVCWEKEQRDLVAKEADENE